MEDITVFELKEKMDAGELPLLIDVREVHERAEFNIGGKHIPLGFVIKSISDLAEYKNDEIVMYCRSGKRSALAQGWLLQAGFKRVRNLTGGMLAWQDAFAK